jgi:hypothetical protein
MAEAHPHPNPPPLAGEGRVGAVRVKRALPSLIGGIFTAIVAFVLWLLLFGAGNVPLIILGAVLSIGLGAWIRLADL